MESFQTVLEVFQDCKQSLGEILSAFEFIDAESMNVITDNLKLLNPISRHPFYILIETSGNSFRIFTFVLAGERSWGIERGCGGFGGESNSIDGFLLDRIEVRWVCCF